MASISSVRPVTAWCSAISNGMPKEEFRNHLKTAMSNKWFSPLNVRHYDIVRVLTISWDADGERGLCIDRYPMDLGQLFYDEYSYLWDHLSLESNDSDPQETFEEQLKETFDDLSDDSLVVIYYIGHGRNHRDALVLEPSMDGSTAPGFHGRHLDFTKAYREIISTSKAHVLTLLDCCHPPEETLRAHGKEIIAASMVPQPPSVGKRPFSAGLIEVLTEESKRQNITSASLLFSRLANKLFETSTRDEDPNLSRLPVFFPSSPGSSLPVCLAPLHDDADTWRPSPLLNTATGPLRVILAAKLFDAEDICSVATAYEWLKDPVNLGLKPFNSFTFSRISIQKVHDTAAGKRIVFMVPLDVWTNLPEMRGVSFLSFDLQRSPSNSMLDDDLDDSLGDYLEDESSGAIVPVYEMTGFDEKEPVKRAWSK